MEPKSPNPDTSRRGYTSHYSVSLDGVQHDRFGRDKRRLVWEMLSDNNIQHEQDEFKGEWWASLMLCGMISNKLDHANWAPRDVPPIQRLRLNLTALSQRFNLYFVSYVEFIHVYIPQRGKEIVYGSPVAVLHPKDSRTPMAQYVRGHIKVNCAACINNMVVGDLGGQEILLICRDNGDVAAWYTETIAKFVLAQVAWERHPQAAIRNDPALGPPQPGHFFTDNVGLSAWGIAIHSKSRLIAVSANTREVTVFAFALSEDKADAQQFDGENIEDNPLHQSQAGFQPSFQTVTQHGKPGSNRLPGPPLLERLFQSRRRSWRIIIPFGGEASNIPSVTFVDDEKGHADCIAAIDSEWYSHALTCSLKCLMECLQGLPCGVQEKIVLSAGFL